MVSGVWLVVCAVVAIAVLVLGYTYTFAAAGAFTLRIKNAHKEPRMMMFGYTTERSHVAIPSGFTRYGDSVGSQGVARGASGGFLGHGPTTVVFQRLNPGDRMEVSCDRINAGKIWSVAANLFDAASDDTSRAILVETNGSIASVFELTVHFSGSEVNLDRSFVNGITEDAEMTCGTLHVPRAEGAWNTPKFTNLVSEHGRRYQPDPSVDATFPAVPSDGHNDRVSDALRGCVQCGMNDVTGGKNQMSLQWSCRKQVYEYRDGLPLCNFVHAMKSSGYSLGYCWPYAEFECTDDGCGYPWTPTPTGTCEREPDKNCPTVAGIDMSTTYATPCDLPIDQNNSGLTCPECTTTDSDIQQDISGGTIDVTLYSIPQLDTITKPGVISGDVPTCLHTSCAKVW